MQYWNLVVENASRKGAKYRDCDGLYPLHWACSGGPPTEVIDTLLKVYPSAACKHDKEGSTPLHFATHYSASVSVVEAVLNTYPKAASMQDRYGRTPLYHAVEKSAGIDVLDHLIRANPSVITLPCLQHGQRKLPMSRAIARRTPLYMAWSAVLLDRKTKETKRGKKWEKAQLLLESAYKHMQIKKKGSSAASTPYHFLHAAIELDIYLPEEVVSMAVTMHPEQLRTEEVGTKRIPLLQAAATNLFSRSRSDELIRLLLQHYPAAATARDVHGKSALQLAAESGKPWAAGLQRLFDANPDAVQWLDNVGISPVLAAAQVQTTLEDKEDPQEIDENPLGLLTPKDKEIIRRRRIALLKPTAAERGITVNEHLSTTFQLLTAEPSVITVHLK